MKVTEHIARAKNQTQFTFEILPPLKGQNIQSIYDSIDPLMEFNPPFIDVTYHQRRVCLQRVGRWTTRKACDTQASRNCWDMCCYTT